jgi:tetratricopeptide (TPR) repeat protein
MKKPSADKYDLSVEIEFLQGLRAQMPHDLELLKILGDDYTKAGLYEEGLNVDLELARLLPDDAVVHYNLACSFSILQRLKEAANALIKAIKLGYTEWEWLENDTDLKNLRESEEFERVRPFMKKVLKKAV